MRVTCVVDNCVSRGGLLAEHGLSLLVEAQGGRVLFDTGESGAVVRHNLKALRAAVPDAVVLSHGHTDHTGGLEALAPLLSRRPLVAHPGIFEERFSGPERRSIGMNRERQQVLEHAFLPRLSDQPTEVVPGVWTTGEIRQRPYPEGRGKLHVVKVGDSFAPDPYRDDLSLVLKVRDGVVVLLGCAHAGVLNILEAVRERLDVPLVAVIGGTHLAGVPQEHLRELSQRLQAWGSPQLYLNHCTGADSLFHLRYLMPDLVRPFGAGSQVEFAQTALA
ncbi:MAG: MBL fold metallo-hydrolase [Anaerolineae bacterium]|nr:MBL fold metallo-hydrolase [Anaerolineae bacterium]